jgi:hypothetical protein
VTREPYPLQWPDGWRRTRPNERKRSRFGDGKTPMSAYSTAQALVSELERLGATRVVITSFLPTRPDRLPYSDGRSEDPGVAVWCSLPDAAGILRERVFACDKWTTAAENMRAIELSVAAMRGLERWGMTDIVGRVVAGFAALPSGPPPKPSWRAVFGVEGMKLEGDDLLAVVKARYRKQVATAHPDAGGSHDRVAALTEAFREAEFAITPPACATSMGCLCASHARGEPVASPCNASETP